MRLDRFIAKDRIIDLQSTDLEGALSELLDTCPLTGRGKQKKADILEALLDREQNMTTYLGNGIALPHIRLPIKRPYIFAIGRCPEGLQFEGMDEYANLRFIFLLLAGEKEPSYLNVLSSLARIFQDQPLVENLLDAPSLEDFQYITKQAFGGIAPISAPKTNKFNKLLLKESAKVAKGGDCTSIMVFADTFEDPLELEDHYKDFKTIVVSQSSTTTPPPGTSLVSVHSYSRTRLSQMRSAVLIGLSRGLLNFNDRICCIAGIPKSNQWDTVVVVDIQKEFQTVFSKQSEILPASVKPEVMERVLAIATELAVEGREGKSVGTLFVIGDTKELRQYTKPLVLNPFHGYKDEDRNILNPFMDETVKEFSTIDGAFTIRGDGVLDSAGSLIYAPDFTQELPGGLGSRHAAAAAITQATDCIAIIVSASTHHVTIFRRGQMLPLM